MSLEPNSVFTITGRNGSGKSTLLKAATGLLEKKTYIVSGEIYFNEVPVNFSDYAGMLQLRKEKIKYVFQDAINSFNPLMKLGYYFERFPGDPLLTDELLDYFLLPDQKNLSSLNPYEVSGGMAQRIALVLAFRSNSDLLIFDEPTSALDSPVVNLLLNKMKEYISHPGKSILLATQDQKFAREISNKTAVLKNGTIAGVTGNDSLNPAASPEGSSDLYNRGLT